METRKIAIACRGGGIHGAFTCEVLNRLLKAKEDEKNGIGDTRSGRRCKIYGLSGTSAGVLNAFMVWYGMMLKDGQKGRFAAARQAINNLWDTFQVSKSGEWGIGSRIGALLVIAGFVLVGAEYATAAPLGPDDPPVNPGNRYVALGDSFSSGEGAGNYLPAAPGRPEACHRSRNAYSQLLARHLLGGVQHSSARDFLACSGDEVPQLKSRQLGALSAGDVSVITIGIGGNDAGWVEVIKKCMIDAGTHPRPGSGIGCHVFIADVFRRTLPVLRQRLNEAYAIIKRDAPRAKVIVVGYPPVFADGLSSTFCASVGLLTIGARSNLREAAEQLNREIGAIAKSFGFRFVDPSGAFKDHRICDPKEDWIHGVTLGRNGEPVFSPITFHPNASGQRGLANAIAAANPDLFR